MENVHYWDHRAVLMIKTAQLFSNKNPNGVLIASGLTLEHSHPLVSGPVFPLMSAQEVPIGLAVRIRVLHDHRIAAFSAWPKRQPVPCPVRHVEPVLDMSGLGFNRDWHGLVR